MGAKLRLATVEVVRPQVLEECMPTKNTKKTRTVYRKNPQKPVGIPERKRPKRPLSMAGEDTRQLLRQSNVAMIVTHGLKQRNELVNDRFTALFGYTIEDIPDVAHWWRLAYPDEAYRRTVKTEWQSRVEKALRGGTDIEPMVATVRCKDGSFRHIEARLTCVGETSVVTLIDLTARKRAEDATRESERRYRRIVETTSEGVWLLDSQFVTSYVNRQMAAMLGYEPGDMVGRSVLEFYFAEDVEEKKRTLERRQRGQSEQIEERLRCRDGAELWVRMIANAIFKDTGEFDGALAMVADITERRQAGEALKKSEEKFAKAFRHSPVGLSITTVKDHRYIEINETFERATGWRRDEIIGRTPFDIGFWVEPPGRIDLAKRIQTDGFVRNVEVQLRMKDGSIRTGLASAEGIELNGEQCIIITGVDITERKLAEEAVEKMSRRLIEAQEQERSRIARELHDDIGQRLALVCNGLEQLQRSASGSPAKILGQMGELRSETSQIATDLQSLSHELHSSKLELLGAAIAMKGFCREYAEQQRVEIKCEMRDLPSDLSPDIALCLFRVLQEALRNAIKHSGGKRFEVQSWGTTDEVHLTISDSGSGFELAAARDSRGLGLVSMEERLNLLKGTLSIDSQPNRGTAIHARVPIDSGNHSARTAG